MILALELLGMISRSLEGLPCLEISEHVQEGLLENAPLVAPAEIDPAKCKMEEEAEQDRLTL